MVGVPDLAKASKVAAATIRRVEVSLTGKFRSRTQTKPLCAKLWNTWASISSTRTAVTPEYGFDSP
jgi:hypothetical protein